MCRFLFLSGLLCRLVRIRLLLGILGARLLCDDDRLHAALDYLLAESEKRQILLFTCQKREMDYLSGRKNVTIACL